MNSSSSSEEELEDPEDEDDDDEFEEEDEPELEDEEECLWGKAIFSCQVIAFVIVMFFKLSSSHSVMNLLSIEF